MAEAARTLSVGETTARRYIDLLQDLFMVRLLQPWYANLGKRQVKTPKVYICDTGLLSYKTTAFGSESHEKVLP